MIFVSVSGKSLKVSSDCICETLKRRIHGTELPKLLFKSKDRPLYKETLQGG